MVEDNVNGLSLHCSYDSFIGQIARKAELAPGIFRRGADASDEGAKIWFSGYYRCQKSPKKLLFTFRRGASLIRRGL